MEVQTERYRLQYKNYYFRLTAWAAIDFEKLKGYPMPESPSFEDTLAIAFVGTKEGMKDKGLPFEFTLDEYITVIDTDIAGINDLFERLNSKVKKKNQGKDQQNP